MSILQYIVNLRLLFTLNPLVNFWLTNFKLTVIYLKFLAHVDVRFVIYRKKYLSLVDNVLIPVAQFLTSLLVLIRSQKKILLRINLL